MRLLPLKLTELPVPFKCNVMAESQYGLFKGAPEVRITGESVVMLIVLLAATEPLDPPLVVNVNTMEDVAGEDFV